MRKISIDWQKAEEHPDKGQKVEGRFLLDLRAKVNDLEKQLTDTKNELNRTQNNLKSTGESLESTTNNLESSKSSLDSTKAELGETTSKLEQTLGELEEKTKSNANLNSEIEGLKANLESANSKVSELEGKIEELGTNIKIGEVKTRQGTWVYGMSLEGFEKWVKEKFPDTADERIKIVKESYELDQKRKKVKDSLYYLNSEEVEAVKALIDNYMEKK